MASVLPSNLSFFMSRLQGVGTSHFKVNPQTSGDMGPSKIVRFELPSNTLLNFRSLRLFFNATTSGAAATAVSLPNDISSLIERVSVYIGGVLVANGFNGYNTLVHAKAALQGYKCGALAHPEMVRRKKYHDGTAAVLANDAKETYTPDHENSCFCIDNFEGFLGTCEPSIMDTGAVSTIVVELQLAEGTVCSSSLGRFLPNPLAADSGITGRTTPGVTSFACLPKLITDTALNAECDKEAGAPSFTLSQMSLQVEVLQMATNVLDTIVEQRIAQVGYLSVPFKNYFSFQNLHTGSTRFNVNSASWDRLWACYRPDNYATARAARMIKGHKVRGGFVGSTVTTGGTPNATYDAAEFVNDIGIPTYDFGGAGVLNTNSEKYKPYYFNFSELKLTEPLATTYQLQINSANIPSYPMTAPEAFAMSMNSLDYYDKNHKITLDQYKSNYFIQCWRFCLPDSDYSRLASGLDCRGVSSSCALNTKNLLENKVNLTLFAECTSELRIGSGRQIEVIT